MRAQNLRAAGLAAVAMAALAAAVSGAKAAEQPIRPTLQETQVVALLSSLGTGSIAPLAVIDPHHYTQHNLGVPDGVDGLKGLVKTLPKGPDVVKTVRIFQDHDYVFAQSVYNFGGPIVAFDIFRFQNGRIVEHWDHLQPMAKANPSGHTMIDGPSQATGLSHTQANRALVQNFVEDILVNGRMAKLAGYFDGDHYIQHNPQIGDGVSGLRKALAAMSKAGIVIKYNRVHKVLAEGDMVLVQSEGSFAGKPTAFYDLFRVENGKIAEHWDVLESIPGRTKWKNPHGKF